MRKTAARVKVLEALRDGNAAIHVSGLADRLGLSKGTVSNLLVAFEREGWVSAYYEHVGGPGAPRKCYRLQEASRPVIDAYLALATAQQRYEQLKAAHSALLDPKTRKREHDRRRDERLLVFHAYRLRKRLAAVGGVYDPELQAWLLPSADSARELGLEERTGKYGRYYVPAGHSKREQQAA